MYNILCCILLYLNTCIVIAITYPLHCRLLLIKVVKCKLQDSMAGTTSGLATRPMIRRGQHLSTYLWLVYLNKSAFTTHLHPHLGVNTCTTIYASTCAIMYNIVCSHIQLMPHVQIGFQNTVLALIYCSAYGQHLCICSRVHIMFSLLLVLACWGKCRSTTTHVGYNLCVASHNYM